MPTLNDETVPYCGSLNVYAEGSPSAWGARLIVNQDGYVDFVHDRQGAAGVDRAEFLDLLNAEFPLNDLMGEVRMLLSDGKMNARESKHFVLYKTDTIVVHANTNGSGGYCYIIAVARTPETDKIEAELNGVN